MCSHDKCLCGTVRCETRCNYASRRDGRTRDFDSLGKGSIPLGATKYFQGDARKANKEKGK